MSNKKIEAILDDILTRYAEEDASETLSALLYAIAIATDTYGISKEGIHAALDEALNQVSDGAVEVVQTYGAVGEA